MEVQREIKRNPEYPMRQLGVDDERLSCSMLERMLKKLQPGAMVHTYTNPNLVLIDLKELEHQPEVALLDIEMFGISGIALAKKIKEVATNINIIFVTGYQEYAVEAFSLRASGYRLKQISEEEYESNMEILQEELSIAEVEEENGYIN